MAHPTISPAEFTAIQEANKREVKRQELPAKVIKSVVTITKEFGYAFSETVALCVFISIYFTFTGLAILFNRKMPKEWLDLMKSPRIKGIAGKVIKKTAENEVFQEVRQAKVSKKSYKVVDLESGSTLPVS